MNTPTADIQSLSPSAIIDLWVLDCTESGGATYRFHGGTNELGGAIIWQGATYQPMPVEIEGLERSSQGALPRPTFRVAALDGLIVALLGPLDDLIGAKVIRRRTLAKYLDAANYTAGNPTADPLAGWPEEVYYVEARTAETPEILEFQLVSALDLQGLKLPRRRVQATICPWVFKGTGCDYVGADSSCAKTLAACAAKFGQSPARFGGFPAAGRIR